MVSINIVICSGLCLHSALHCVPALHGVPQMKSATDWTTVTNDIAPRF